MKTKNTIKKLGMSALLLLCGAITSHAQDTHTGGGDDNDEDMDIDSHAGRAKNSTVVAERKKGETAEEKRSRKNAVKEAKREARVAKKDLKMLYKDESAKAHRRAATAQVQPSVHL